MAIIFTIVIFAPSSFFLHYTLYVVLIQRENLVTIWVFEFHKVV